MPISAFAGKEFILQAYEQAKNLRLSSPIERTASCLHDRLLIRLLFRFGCRVSEALTLKFASLKRVSLCSACLEDEDQGDDHQDNADSDNYPDPQRSCRSLWFRWWCCWRCFSLEAEGSAPVAWRWLESHHSPEVVAAVIQRALILEGGGGHFCLLDHLGHSRILSQDELVLRGLLEW
jgi:hypothetical protein